MSLFPIQRRTMAEVDRFYRLSLLERQIAVELRRLATMPIDKLRAMPGTAVNYIR